MRHLFQNRTSLTYARTARTRSTAPWHTGRERRREPESGECGLPPPLAPACPPMPTCLPCHPLPCGISLPVGLIVVLKPPVCIPCRGNGCQGHDEERGAGRSAAGKMARMARVPHPVGSSVSLGPDLQPSRLLCRFAGLRQGSALAGGCRSAGCVLSVAQVSTTQPWPVNLCLVPDRHRSRLCQKLPPFWKSLPSGTPCFSTLSPLH